MTTVLERIASLEQDVRRIDRELVRLRADVTSGEAAAPLRGFPMPEQRPEQRPQPRPEPDLKPAPPPPATRVPAPPGPSLIERLEAADLLGGRGLAVAGGIVTLLGVVFFFALAASNGWIGPVERVLLGAVASAVVFAGGVVAHARYGRLDAAVAAAGAGIAGGYATLLFAAARYELVPPLGALALAAGIAAVGVVLSLRWSSEIVAAFGLIGAMCVPAVAVLDDAPTATGAAFVALVFLGAAVVGIWQRWKGLLVAAGLVSVPQLALLVLDEGEPARARVLAIAAVFGLLYLGTGVARQLREGAVRLDGVASAYAGGNVAVTLFSAFVLLEGNALAVGVAAAALVYAALAVAAWRDQNELASLAVAASSVLAAVAAAQFLDGPSLVVAWAAETALLAWLGRRLADMRFQLLGLGYLLLALAYTLLLEAEPDLLFTRGADHLAGVPALLAVAAGAAAWGVVARAWPAPRSLDSMPRFLRDLVEGLHAQQLAFSAGALGTAALLLADAVSLSLLELFEWLGIEPSFDWGHVAVSATWSLVGLGLLAVGLRRSRVLELVGLGVLIAVAASFALFTVSELPHVSGWSALVLAGAGAATALVYGLFGGRLLVVAAGAVAVGALASAFASEQLLADDLRGYGLLASAAAHALVAAAVWRRRDLASSFWVAGAVLATVAAGLLLDETWLVLALAGGAAAAAVLGRGLAEPRLWLPAAALTGLAGLYTLGQLARPELFVDASVAPAVGVPAVLLVLGALAALLLSLRRVDAADELDRRIDAQVEAARRLGRWLFAAVGLYGASLAVLGLVEALSSASETTELQRGHTAVSALWGTIAFTAVLVGLRRGVRVLRLAGLGLFALALGKLFLYDLATLSSVTRALSFLAVGAVLLLAGFFYQRLSAETAAL